MSGSRDNKDSIDKEGKKVSLPGELSDELNELLSNDITDGVSRRLREEKENDTTTHTQAGLDSAPAAPHNAPELAKPQINKKLSNSGKPSQSSTLAVEDKKPIWFSVLIFILLLLYLFPEAIFNAQLVSIAGGKDINAEQLRIIELFGRTVSGIGVSILVADMLIKGKLLKRPLIALAYLAGIFLVAWPLTFFGQKWAIDTLIVNPSSIQQRHQAFFTNILKSGLSINAIQLEGVDYDPEKANHPAEMTFLALMGSLIYADEEFLDGIESQKNQIVRNYVLRSAQLSFPQYYQRYKNMRETIRSSWVKYDRAATRYHDKINSIDETYDKHLVNIQDAIREQWASYLNKNRVYRSLIKQSAKSIAPIVVDTFRAKNKCFKKHRSNLENRDQCIATAEKPYHLALNQNKLPTPPLDYWLITQKVSTSDNVINMTTTALFTGGLSLAILGADKVTGGDGGWKETEQIATDNLNFYQEKITDLIKPLFIKEVGGYPWGIESLNQFRSHPLATEYAKSITEREGFKLPDSWQISQFGVLREVITTTLRNAAETEWMEAVEKHNLNISPNLNWHSFQLQPAIQDRILQEMGRQHYVNPMLADWNDQIFFEKVIEPNIERETKRALNLIQAAEAQFADGAPLAEDGKKALRAVIIPPISMTLSLFLVLMSVLKLPAKALEIYRHIKHDQPKPRSILDHVLNISIVVFIVTAFPFFFSENKFIGKKSGVSYFLERVEEHTHPIVSNSLVWVMQTQPIVFPVGHSLDEKIKLWRFFDKNREPLDKLDSWVNDAVYTNDMTADERAAQQMIKNQVTAAIKTGKVELAYLTIETSVQDATIHIMNIKEKYQSGMELPAGNYDIKVNAPGYKEERRWISVPPGASSHKFNLQTEQGHL